MNRIIAGDEQGIIRTLELPTSTEFKEETLRIQIFGEPNPERAVTCLSYLTTNGKYSDFRLFGIGRRNGQLDVCRDDSLQTISHSSATSCNSYPVFVKSYSNLANEKFPRLLSVWNTGEICIQRFRKNLETCLHRGCETQEISVLKKLLTIKAANQISTSDICTENSTILFGGDGVNLSICDIPYRKITFSSKPPKNPYGLLKRHWTSACCFIPHTKGQVAFCGTAEHELCLYDIRSGKRPVYVMEQWRDGRVTCSYADPNGDEIWVSSATGYIDRFDLRTQAIRGSLTGQVGGSIRDFKLFEWNSTKMLASVGLDRMLRIHSTKDKKLRLKQYCKYQLNVLDVFSTGDATLFQTEGSKNTSKEITSKRKYL